MLNDQPFDDDNEDKEFNIITALIKAGADVRFKAATRGWHPLFRAAKRTDPRFVTLLLSKGANVNLSTDSGYTALMAAHAVSYSTNQKTIAVLIKNGAEVNAVNNEGRTALFYAVINYRTHSEITALEALIKLKANVNVIDAKKETPLLLAVKLRAVDVIKVLVKAGGKIDGIHNNNEASLIELCDEQDFMGLESFLKNYEQSKTTAPVTALPNATGPSSEHIASRVSADTLQPQQESVVDNVISVASLAPDSRPAAIDERANLETTFEDLNTSISGKGSVMPEVSVPAELAHNPIGSQSEESKDEGKIIIQDTDSKIAQSWPETLKNSSTVLKKPTASLPIKFGLGIIETLLVIPMLIFVVWSLYKTWKQNKKPMPQPVVSDTAIVDNGEALSLAPPSFITAFEHNLVCAMTLGRMVDKNVGKLRPKVQ